jgi:hypothetical protein
MQTAARNRHHSLDQQLCHWQWDCIVGAEIARAEVRPVLCNDIYDRW